MTWRAARSLLVLRAELDNLCPNRSTASDGIVGDTAHSSRVSDHNPDARGIVHAIDLTHDPEHGARMARLAEYLRTHRHPALKYLIYNRRIASANSSPPWSWRTYTGSNPHTSHLHVSIYAAAEDSKRAWGVAKALRPEPQPEPQPEPDQEPERHEPGSRTLRLGKHGADVGFVQRYIGALWCGRDDEDFGPQTRAGVRRYQALRGLTVDGVVGHHTWRAMGVLR